MQPCSHTFWLMAFSLNLKPQVSGLYWSESDFPEQDMNIFGAAGKSCKYACSIYWLQLEVKQAYDSIEVQAGICLHS